MLLGFFSDSMDLMDLNLKKKDLFGQSPCCVSSMDRARHLYKKVVSQMCHLIYELG